MFVALVGLGIQLRWPEQRQLGTAFILLGIAVGVAMAIWVIAQRRALASQGAPLNFLQASQQRQSSEINNSPVFAPVFAPNFNQSQTRAQPVTENKAVPPEIECTDCYFVKAALSPSNRLIGSDGDSCMVAQADFYLKPTSGADPWIELRTQLEFYDSANTRLARLRDGMWREQKHIVQMPMRTGDTRTLVIAIELGPGGFNSYEYGQEHVGPIHTTTGIYDYLVKPKLSPLNENVLTVRVCLVGKYLEDVTLTKDFWFSLVRPELTIKQITAPRGDEAHHESA